jgi:hypothetical protein
MIDLPTTLEEAKKYRYGQWAGNPRGFSYIQGRCAYGVYGTGYIESQCTRKNGHGSANLFCRQHAKILSKSE